mmetsp:Transcript_31864/g.62731  ORF Transcript_31864/g.62731 Transcript_31864/m.62731 type:complete len:147 (-) Transcript_31864:242-682(-)
MSKYSISQGQPFDGVTSTSHPGLDVKAGRHGSSGPASDFKAGIQAINALGLKIVGAWTTLPGDLNFAVFGDATFAFEDASITCRDIGLGQGHHDTANNWWLGSPHCFGVPDIKEMTCLCDGLRKLYVSQGDNDHQFNVRDSTEVMV